MGHLFRVDPLEDGLVGVIRVVVTGVVAVRFAPPEPETACLLDIPLLVSTFMKGTLYTLGQNININIHI